MLFQDLFALYLGLENTLVDVAWLIEDAQVLGPTIKVPPSAMLPLSYCWDISLPCLVYCSAVSSVYNHFDHLIINY